MSRLQKAYTWLLLSIMISMQAINAVHIHEPLEITVEDLKCSMCMHHVHHSGHFSSEQYHMHPCLSCQINSFQHFTLQSAITWDIPQGETTLEISQVFSLPAATPSQRQSRAPPVILV